MYRKIVSLLRGDVRARVRCAFPERVLNVCAARAIPLREPRFLGAEELAFSVDRRDWRRLKAACADLGAEAHVERVAGVPFLLGRLRRRYVLLAGAALCALGLLVSSCFIWDIRVEGSDAVPKEQILRVLADCGVRRGAFANGFQQRDLCNRALPRLPGLAWLTVNVRGCRATVVVRERVPKPEIVNESAPTNVVAARDALVTDVRALDGEARVLPADGETRSWAVLWGEKRVKLCGKEGSILAAECDKIISRKQWTLPGGLVLPVTWVTETCRARETVRVTRERDDAEAIGRAVLERELAARIGADGETLSARVSSAVRGDRLLVTLSAECREQIGRVVPIPMG